MTPDRIDWRSMTNDQKMDVPIASLNLPKGVLSAFLAAGFFVIDDVFRLNGAQLVAAGISRRSATAMWNALSWVTEWQQNWLFPECVGKRQLPTGKWALAPRPAPSHTWEGRPGPLWPHLDVLGPWVYFIRCGRYVKIGVAASIVERMAALQGCNPHRLKLWLAIPSGSLDFNDVVRRERQLHETFSAYRVRGEWFAISGPVLRFVRDARFYARSVRERAA